MAANKTHMVVQSVSIAVDILAQEVFRVYGNGCDWAIVSAKHGYKFGDRTKVVATCARTGVTLRVRHEAEELVNDGRVVKHFEAFQRRRVRYTAIDEKISSLIKQHREPLSSYQIYTNALHPSSNLIVDFGSPGKQYYQLNVNHPIKTELNIYVYDPAGDGRLHAYATSAAAEITKNHPVLIQLVRYAYGSHQLRIGLI